MKTVSKKFLSLFLIFAMVAALLPAPAAKAEETTKTIPCGKIVASGSQPDNSENTYLVAVGSGEVSATGSSAAAAHVVGETASKSTILSTGRRVGMGFDLSEINISNPELISNATVTINVKSVNDTMQSASEFWTKAGLFSVPADCYENMTTDESTFLAKDNNYSKDVTVYCAEQILNTSEGLGDKTFDVTNWIKEAIKSGETKAVFRLQSVISGWYMYYTGDNAPTLSITTITEQDAVDRVAAKLSLPKNTAVHLVLPKEGEYGTKISWTSNPSNIIAEDGTVTRPSEDTDVTLTATVTNGSASKTENFTVTVKAGSGDGYYLMSYTNSAESALLGSSLHLAYSLDGKDYTALNSNTGICFAKNTGTSADTNGLKNLYIFRKTDGSYGLAATNISTQKYIYLFDSDNLVDFTNERKLTVNTDVVGDLQVEQQENGYKIYWSDGNAQYGAFTEDLSTVATQGEESYDVEYKLVPGTLPEGAAVGNIFSVSQEECQYVINRLGIVKNTGIEAVEITAEAGETVYLQEKLPQKITAEYSDGSEKEMSVTWDASDIENVDFSQAGTYTVTGTVGQTQYANPFIEQRADPCILKGNDGYYYFTASYPMKGSSDKDGYDKIVLRRSETIEGLADADEITIWDCDDANDEFRYIWAPEIRLVKDQYYVFYTSSTNSGSVWSIRPHVLKCTNPLDIMNPESWEQKGTMQKVSTDTNAFASFSLDMTVFENNERWYAVWAEKPNVSVLRIAEIDPDQPWKCISESVEISTPEYSWERVGEYVNEGPSVIKNGNGKIYLAFSASATGPEYCIGLLSIDEDENLLDVSAWKKQAYPALTSADVPGEYGPGHNSFTVDEEGNDIFVYHARGQECYEDKCSWANQEPLYDPCRDARLKRVHWSVDGSPILKMSYEEELAEEYKTVTATITVNSKSSNDGEGSSGGGVNSGSGSSGGSGSGSSDGSGSGSGDGSGSGSSDGSGSGSSDGSGSGSGDGSGSGSSGGSGSGSGDGNSGGGNSDNGSGSALVASDTTPAAITLSANSSKIKNNANMTLGLTESVKLVATVTNKTGEVLKGQKITWSSNKSKIVAVSSGKITAKKTGTATITAKTSNGKTIKVKVTVKKKPTKLTLAKKSVTIKKGGKYTIKPKLTPAKAASYTITYKSSKPKVASVTNGIVKGLKKGSTTITVKTFNGKSAKVKVTVK